MVFMILAFAQLVMDKYLSRLGHEKIRVNGLAGLYLSRFNENVR